MERNKKQYNQNVLDFVLSNYGSLNGLNDFINRNGNTSVTFPDIFSTVALETEFSVDEEVSNKALRTYKESNYIVITKTPLEAIVVTVDKALLELGQDITINWASTFDDNVKVELYNDETFVIELLADTASTGEYVYTIPLDLALSETYRIKVTRLWDESIFGYSEYFDVQAITPIITVLSPDSLDDWETTVFNTVVWDSNFTDNVKIKLLQAGTEIAVINSLAFNTGTFNWRPDGALETNSNYRIKVERASDPTVFGTSDLFSITQLWINVTSPTLGQEFIRVTDSIDVTWTDNFDYNVSVSLWKGETFLFTHIENAVNTGSTSIPTDLTLDRGDDYRVRVLKFDDRVSDFSDNFTLTDAPTLIYEDGVESPDYNIIKTQFGIETTFTEEPTYYKVLRTSTEGGINTTEIDCEGIFGQALPFYAGDVLSVEYELVSGTLAEFRVYGSTVLSNLTPSGVQTLEYTLQGAGSFTNFNFWVRSDAELLEFRITKIYVNRLT